ncbi:MAG TPA: Trm112 family protein [Planctomycetes bacterium]|nr:Trm112 family protein [Planctomycetota bacterium]HIN80788.1 Trm112 family protein [Planctomycetota bacterium]
MPQADPGGSSKKGPISADLLALLRCPISHGPLEIHDGRLVCWQSRKAYRIVDGIPVLLPEEAEDLPEDETPRGAG